MLAAMAVVIAAATEHAEKKGGLPQLNVDDFAPQLFWLAISFALLYFIMSRVALPRIGEVIEERRDRIQRDLDAADRLKRETEKALAAYEQALAEARGRAGGIAKETREKLGQEVEKERAQVERQIAAKVADAEARISATKEKAVASVGEIAADTAAAMVARLTGEQPRPDEVKAALAG